MPGRPFYSGVMTGRGRLCTMRRRICGSVFRGLGVKVVVRATKGYPRKGDFEPRPFGCTYV